MMKINTKYFNQTTGEPFEVQEVDGMKVSLYFLDNQPFYNEFIGRGKFFFWASDGKESKLILENGYYEVMKQLFTPEVNKHWIEYYDKADAINKKTRNVAVLPLVLGYIVFFVLYMFVLSKIKWFQDAMWVIFIAIIIVMFIFMSKINKYIKNRIDLINNEAIQKIKKIVGKKEYERLLKEQDKYRRNFYKNPDDEDEDLEDENENNEIDMEDEDDRIEEEIKTLLSGDSDILDADEIIEEETIELENQEEEEKGDEK